MIAVDTSALMAVLLRERQAADCITALDAADAIVISAATLAEALLVSALRNTGPEMRELIEELGCEIAPVTEAVARRVARAYARWGKDVHPAGLNFGDCFAYALAEERACPLLFVGDDFLRTDVKPAFARA
ncbi:MAG: type II toxin-antitoxin system VapC family toxin [Hyphomonadaceae bacterium]|nr:type II toxin-antitoxin system VapC family toxin [Hyphomonadaceae bacterium]